MRGAGNFNVHVPTVLKSGILSLLEPSGPVQACIGIDLLVQTSSLATNCKRVSFTDQSYMFRLQPVANLRELIMLKIYTALLCDF